jgi:Flp pilus assembly protein TadB
MTAKKGSDDRAGVDAAFVAQWNALDKQHRRQVRRLVRIGREQENADDARLAVGFAAYQRTRPWFRFFWLWFPVVLVAGVVAGLALHPIVFGMILAVAGNALLVRRAFRRADWVNGRLLGE